MPKIHAFRLTYSGKDVTNDLKPLVQSIAFTDKLEGESDEIEITLDNADLRWLDAWQPKEGDRVSLQFGYVGEALSPEVSFEIDEPEYSGAPDLLRLRGLATPITASLRQIRTEAYENTNLRAIARTIAERQGLELVGNVPEIELERVTQKEQTDLEFLRDLAAEYGLIFKIESTTRLVFFSESEIEEAEAILELRRSPDITSYRLTRGARGTYKSAKISYLDPKTGEYIEVNIAADGTEIVEAEEEEGTEGETDSGTNVASGDVLTIRERFENRDQAVLKATEQLRRANRGQIEGSLEIEGDIRFAGGINITLSGFRNLDGKYQVTEARHSLRHKQEYKTSVRVKAIALTTEEQ